MGIDRVALVDVRIDYTYRQDLDHSAGSAQHHRRNPIDLATLVDPIIDTRRRPNYEEAVEQPLRRGYKTLSPYRHPLRLPRPHLLSCLVESETVRDMGQWLSCIRDGM